MTTVVAARFRELAPKIAEEFAKLRNPDRSSKIMVHDGLDGSVMQILVWTKPHKRALIHVLYVTWHNMSRTAINSKRQVTSLRMLVNVNGVAKRATVQPATRREVEAYCAAFPNYTKTLVE